VDSFTALVATEPISKPAMRVIMFRQQQFGTDPKQQQRANNFQVRHEENGLS